VKKDMQDASKEPAKALGRAPLAAKFPTLLSAINAFPAARMALKTLLNEKCDETALLANLYMYCGGTKEQAASGLKSARQLRATLKPLATQLLRDATAIERVMDSFQNILVAPRFVELADDLRGFAGVVDIAEKASGRIGTRNQHFVYLACLVKAATGDEHYPELTQLVGAIKNETRPDYLKRLQDALLQLVKRSKATGRYSLLENAAEEEVDDWRASASTTKPQP
jgi:hypothetical protein